jgi:hypothetical protein
MTLTTAILLIGVAALVTLTLCLVYELRSALRRMTEAESERDRLAAARETDALSVEAFRRERDEALKAKSSQWEAWQAEATNLRADVAALERLNEQMKESCRALTELNIASRRELDLAGDERTLLEARLSLTEKVVAAAEALASGPNSPGEWAALREAIRARREAS